MNLSAHIHDNVLYRSERNVVLMGKNGRYSEIHLVASASVLY